MRQGRLQVAKLIESRENLYIYEWVPPVISGAEMSGLS